MCPLCTSHACMGLAATFFTHVCDYRDISGEDFYDGLSVSKSAGLSQPLNTHLTVAPTLKTNIAANLLFRNNYIYYTGGRLRNQAPRSTDDVAKFYYIQLDTPFRFKLQSKGAPPDTSTLAANFSENAQQPTLVFTNVNVSIQCAARKGYNVIYNLCLPRVSLSHSHLPFSLTLLPFQTHPHSHMNHCIITAQSRSQA